MLYTERMTSSLLYRQNKRKSHISPLLKVSFLFSLFTFGVCLCACVFPLRRFSRHTFRHQAQHCCLLCTLHIFLFEVLILRIQWAFPQICSAFRKCLNILEYIPQTFAIIRIYCKSFFEIFHICDIPSLSIASFQFILILKQAKIEGIKHCIWNLNLNSVSRL